MSGRTWARIDVSYLTHRKIAAVSDKAKLLHLASILWLHAHGSDDGVLPPHALAHLALTIGVRSLDRYVAELIKLELWHASLDPAGFVVHGFADYIGPQTGNAARQRRWRERHP